MEPLPKPPTLQELLAGDGVLVDSVSYTLKIRPRTKRAVRVEAELRYGWGTRLRFELRLPEHEAALQDLITNRSLATWLISHGYDREGRCLPSPRETYPLGPCPFGDLLYMVREPREGRKAVWVYW